MKLMSATNCKTCGGFMRANTEVVEDRHYDKHHTACRPDLAPAPEPSGNWNVAPEGGWLGGLPLRDETPLPVTPQAPKKQPVHRCEWRGCNRPAMSYASTGWACANHYDSMS